MQQGSFLVTKHQLQRAGPGKKAFFLPPALPSLERSLDPEARQVITLNVCVLEVEGRERPWKQWGKSASCFKTFQVTLRAIKQNKNLSKKIFFQHFLGFEDKGAAGLSDSSA